MQSSSKGYYKTRIYIFKYLWSKNPHFSRVDALTLQGLYKLFT